MQAKVNAAAVIVHEPCVMTDGKTEDLLIIAYDSIEKAEKAFENMKKWITWASGFQTLLLYSKDGTSSFYKIPAEIIVDDAPKINLKLVVDTNEQS